MEILNLIPEIEVYFEYNEKITKGIFKGIQRTNSGKLVKKRNRLIEIINKKGQKVIIPVSKETKFFDTVESLINYKEQLIKQEIEREKAVHEEYLSDIKKIKSNLNKIENINHLPTFEEIDEEDADVFNDMFGSGYKFKLNDETEVEMTKYEYRCIMHSSLELAGIDIYKIDNGQLFKCFDCGELLIEREDLIKKYDLKNTIDDNILFPKAWSEDKIINWIKKRNDK